MSVISFSTTIHIYGRRLMMGCCRVNVWYRRKTSHFSITAFLFKKFHFKYLKNILVLSQLRALFAVLCIIYVNKKNSSLKWGVHETLKLKKYKYIYIYIYIYKWSITNFEENTCAGVSKPSFWLTWDTSFPAKFVKIFRTFFQEI